jgi:hypothetical protein
MNPLYRLLPFLRWLRHLRETGRPDLVDGVTVAPQAMAYTQLAGVPADYGPYAAFLPAAVGARRGAFAQLATGPVAAVSLPTAAPLGTRAAPGGAEFVALAVTLGLAAAVTFVATLAFACVEVREHLTKRLRAAGVALHLLIPKSQAVAVLCGQAPSPAAQEAVPRAGAADVVAGATGQRS